MKVKDIHTQYFNNSKIASTIRANRIISGPENMTSYENPLSNLDMDIADVLYTIFAYADREKAGRKRVDITAVHIIQALSGNFDQRPTAGMIKTIEESIERLRSTDIIIFPGEDHDFVLCAQSEPVDKEWKQGSFSRRPFLEMKEENGYYVIEIDEKAVSSYAVLERFLPLYAYAGGLNKRYKREMCEFDSILLCYEPEPEEKISRKGAPEKLKKHYSHRCTLQYVQIRRLIIRRIVWAMYDKSRKIYSGRNVRQGEDGNFISLPRIIPEYGESRNIGKPRIIYMYYSHRKAAGQKGREMAGLMAQLGILPGEDRAEWRNKKRSVHHDVCKILDSFIDLGYISGYDEIFVPAPYHRRGKKLKEASFSTKKTALEKKRLNAEMGRAKFCRKTMNYGSKYDRNKAVKKLEDYEWYKKDVIWTSDEWQNFADVLGCKVEDIKEPVHYLNRLESAREECGLSREELAEYLLLLEIYNEKDKKAREKRGGKTGLKTDKEKIEEYLTGYIRKKDISVKAWLDEIPESEKNTRRYQYHLEFINTEEARKRPYRAKEDEDRKRNRECQLLATVLTDLSPDKTKKYFPEDLRQRNLTLYGVEINGVKIKSLLNPVQQ